MGEGALRHPIVVAIDGPAASGKGTLARKLAEYLGVEHLDTGRLYRAVAYKLIHAPGYKSDQATIDKEAAIEAAYGIELTDIRGPNLATEEVGRVASMVAVIPEVRYALLHFQRSIAANPAGAVLDGRDVGSIVCPDADVKIFVTASVESRAFRRFKELQAKGFNVIYEGVLSDLMARDERDTKRAASPLVVPKGAYCLDTTHMDADAVLKHVIAYVAPYLKSQATAKS